MHLKTYCPHESVPDSTILPMQTHGTNIIEVVTGKEDLSDCDGLWTNTATGWQLGVRTADCAPVVFYSDCKYGVIHAGWRGLCNGIVEKMCKEFSPDLTHIWVGPLLPVFEIQRDTCFEQIQAKFGDQFFMQKSGKTYFDFKSALRHLLPTAEFDTRSTYDNPDLASWRRDRDNRRNITIIRPNE